ncbi:MAG: hypothetical protein BWY91_03241 [bacterium ADurb.BinA028]|nr:MAG: hypothetical protein BWY91_03241 [bacterium ADurb.BinA028]
MLRTSSTRTPILWKQSGGCDRVGVGSVRAGGVGAGRLNSPVTVIEAGGSALTARARHQDAEPAAGAGWPSIDVPARAAAVPSALPATTLV